MNKGMIMEVKRNYAITLNDEGIMDKIASKHNMEVGQKIFYFEDDIVKTSAKKAYRQNNFIKAFGSIAALFLLVFTFFNTMNYEQAYAVVSLDINPSIQIEADSNQKIIKVEGVNIDGKNIDFSDIKDISINDGIDKIREKLIEKNYLDTNKEVLVGYAFIKNGDNSAYIDNLKEAIQTTFKTDSVTVTYVVGDKKGIDEAKSKNISLGRYEASLRVDDETKNNIDKAPVKDITSSIIDKKNVDEWQAKDEKAIEKNGKTSDEALTNTEVKPETKVVDKPVIKVPTEKDEPNNATDIEKGNNNNNTKPEDDGALNLKPEVPPTQSTENNTPIVNPSKDSNIIAPNGGAIKNNTTSGKIEEQPKKN